jgi:hypothetical protein
VAKKAVSLHYYKESTMDYTIQDYREKRCTLDQVGCEIPEVVVRPPNGTAKETVNLFMDAFHELGGLDELVKFGRANPGKFYDQLLRLLISMDAPKQSAQSTKNLEATAEGELLSMSSADLKRALMEK